MQRWSSSDSENFVYVCVYSVTADLIKNILQSGEAAPHCDGVSPYNSVSRYNEATHCNEATRCNRMLYCVEYYQSLTGKFGTFTVRL